MGPDPKTSVVDPELRVHGIDNLRVMDASVFPTSASSHTMLPVMAFAHLAAMELSRRP
jgi:choline dehydrogenase